MLYLKGQFLPINGDDADGNDEGWFVVVSDGDDEDGSCMMEGGLCP